MFKVGDKVFVQGLEHNGFATIKIKDGFNKSNFYINETWVQGWFPKEQLTLAAKVTDRDLRAFSEGAAEAQRAYAYAFVLGDCVLVRGHEDLGPLKINNTSNDGVFSVDGLNGWFRREEFTLVSNKVVESKDMLDQQEYKMPIAIGDSVIVQGYENLGFLRVRSISDAGLFFISNLLDVFKREQLIRMNKDLPYPTKESVDQIFAARQKKKELQKIMYQRKCPKCGLSEFEIACGAKHDCNPFNVGDRVVCINAKVDFPNVFITEGKIYIVCEPNSANNITADWQRQAALYVWIVEDDGRVGGWEPSRFKLVTEDKPVFSTAFPGIPLYKDADGQLTKTPPQVDRDKEVWDKSKEYWKKQNDTLDPKTGKPRMKDTFHADMDKIMQQNKEQKLAIFEKMLHDKNCRGHSCVDVINAYRKLVQEK